MLSKTVPKLRKLVNKYTKLLDSEYLYGGIEQNFIDAVEKMYTKEIKQSILKAIMEHKLLEPDKDCGCCGGCGERETCWRVIHNEAIREFESVIKEVLGEPKVVRVPFRFNFKKVKWHKAEEEWKD